MAEKRKITFKLLGPDGVWHPKVGPPFGTRNAWKTGLHTAEVRDLRRRLSAFRARAGAALAALENPKKPRGRAMAAPKHSRDSGKEIRSKPRSIP